MSRRNSLLLRLPLLFVSALSLLSGPAYAENPRVTEPTDFIFTFGEPTTFFARTFDAEGFRTDPMLWLYDSQDTLIIANDDYHGLQSQLQVEVPAGTYRLRAGVCCGNPDAWRQGHYYDITYNGVATIIGSTTTTLPEETTTSSSSTSTTTTSSTTTTTIQETTTTWATTTTTVLTPIVTVETTIPATTTTVNAVPETTIETLIPQERSNDGTTTTSVPVVVRTTTPATTIATVPVATTTLPTVTTAPSVQEPTNEPENDSEGAIKALQATSVLTVEALEEVLDDIQVSELSEEQESQLVAVLNVATEEVKQAFEEQVNVYAEGLDEYVPSGSVVPVKTRRVLIATAALFMSFPTVVSTPKAEIRRIK